MKKIFSMIIIATLVIQNSSYARVIYDIDKTSMNEYKISLKWLEEDKQENIQMTGNQKYNDNTIKVSYDTGSEVFDYRSMSIDNKMIPLKLDNGYALPNIKLSGTNNELVDVTDNLEGKTDIENLYNRGIINGYPDDTFKPNNLITREEFCALFYKAGEFTEGAATNQFTDIAESRWSKKYISVLAKKGIIKGKEVGKFSPTDNITLGEIATMIDRMYTFTVEVVGRSYKHLGTSHWSNNSLTKVMNADIIKETDDFYKNHNQDKKLTREEMSIILNRVVNRFKETRE